jgi:hypothetical protein
MLLNFRDQGNGCFQHCIWPLAQQQLGNADRILALQHWHFSNANQHLIIENQYFRNAVFLNLDTQGDLDLVVFRQF